MLTFMTIPNAERFLDLVAKSCGDVLLYLRNGERYSLKENHVAREMLRTMSPGAEGLKIGLSDSRDTPAFFQYMLESGR